MNKKRLDSSRLDSTAAYFGVIALLVSIVSLIVVLGFYVSTFKSSGLSSEPSAWGQFGDYVGGALNPLFAFFSFMALIITIWLQRAENNRQQRFLLQQNFETVFFQMLNRFSVVLREIEVPGNLDPEAKTHGRSAITKLYGKLKRTLDGRPNDGKPTTTYIRNTYQIFYKETNPYIAHYFRTLYHIFKLIHLSGLDESERVRYANIARAQLSTNETLLLFYNGLSAPGEKFKSLIECYGLLKHAIPEELVDRAHRDDESLYQRTAFMDEDERNAYWIKHPTLKAFHSVIQ